MRNIFVISLFSCLWAISGTLAAQNLDPTVEVTREYEGKLVEIHKPSLEMSVPDTVTHFALDFDYSVFENPYKGAYDFNPYTLSMKPSSSDTGERRLYLRAGAGYQLKPELDVVWSPVRGKAFNMDIYATHRSFLGNYWKLAPQEADGEIVFDRVPVESTERTWPGYDILTKAGVDCRYDKESVVWGFGAGYYGLARKSLISQASLNALDARMTVTTKPEQADGLRYDIAAAYRFAHDRLSSASALSEHVFDFDMNFGPVLRGRHQLDFDLGVDLAAYGGAFRATAGQVSVTPQYVFKTSRIRLNVGLLLSKLVHPKAIGAKEQYVYPDITFSYVLLPEAMKLYVAAKGGNVIDTYSSILSRNHHLTYAGAAVPTGCTTERAALSAGFDGRISSRFSYNVRGGYVCYGNAFLDAVVFAPTPYPSFAYAPYQKWFVALDWLLKTERFRMDGAMSYDRAWGDVFHGLSAGMTVLKPAAFTGDVSCEVNWNRRIFFGADCSFSTARKGGIAVLETTPDLAKEVEAKIPGYADLGVFAEYVTARRLSFWLRAGNLLNMTVQRIPLYAEKGVNFTVGICLSL